MPLNKYQKEYLARINKVLDYIEANLQEELTIQQISEVAAFSPYHFHRIFSAIVKEPLGAYISRKRIEYAARMLYREPEMTVTEIAESTGFNSTSVFCRNFKSHFKISAAQFRENPELIFSKNRQLKSKISQPDGSGVAYVCNIQNPKNGEIMLNKGIEIKNMPEMNLIYTRHVGEFHLIGQAYGKLMQWAGPRGLLNNPDFKTVTVYHDDPNVTEMGKVRQSASITVSEDVQPEGEFGKMTVPAAKSVVGHFEIDATQFKQAWDEVCIWLSESGYQPADGNPYELYHKDPEDHPEKKFVLDICIPVKPM
jgi:AraC family transcriptional regulator